MPKLVHPKTGSVVTVADEQVEQVEALGFELDGSAKKTAAKKTAANKSNK